MADSREISGTVKIAENSAHRVAFDLVKYLINASPEKRDEVIALYARCVQAGSSPNGELDRRK